MTIDAIKYKVFHLTKQVKDIYKPSEEKKDYRCPRCKAEWTQMDVLDNVGLGGFLCHRCGTLLQQNEQAVGNTHGHEKSSKLMTQLDKLLKLLQQIDSEDIPQNDFETAIAHAVPIHRDEYVNPSRQNPTQLVGSAPPTTVKGITQAADTLLEVNLTTSSELSAAEQTAEAERKAAIANSNVMPVWHTNSTVTGESTITKAASKDGQTLPSMIEGLKPEEKESKDGLVLNEELEAYYAQMAEEKQKEAEEDAELDDTDDNESDFEDVDVEKEEDIPLGSSNFSGGDSNHRNYDDTGTVNPCSRESHIRRDTPGLPQPFTGKEDRPRTQQNMGHVAGAAVLFHSQGGKSSNFPEHPIRDEDDDFEDAI